MELERLEKLANDTKLEINDIRACVSLIEFILISSSKYNVNGEILSSELQQLGLPKGKPSTSPTFTSPVKNPLSFFTRLRTRNGHV